MQDLSVMRANMIVVAEDGTPIGRVDNVDAGRIKLTRSDSPDGQHHYLSLSAVASVTSDEIVLSMSIQAARRITAG